MTSSGIVRWGGLAAMVGGALWMALFALFASRPSGPGPAPPFRSFEGLYLPHLVSVVLIAAELVALHAHLRGTYGGLGTAGFALASAGATVLVVSGASWPWERVGVLGLLLGSILMGAATLRMKAPPRWGAVVLVVGSLAFFLFDTETTRVWFALPYGGAWVVAGYLLWSGVAEAARRPTRVR